MGVITVREPHPTVAKNAYIHAGRGGAGNFIRAPATTPSSGVPSPVTTVPSHTGTTNTTSTSSSGYFYSGRGGAGNARSAAQRAPASFDEDLARAEVREKTAYMVGRGGAGNFSGRPAAASDKNERKHSTASVASSGSSRRDSGESAGRASGFFARLSLSKH